MQIRMMPEARWSTAASSRRKSAPTEGVVWLRDGSLRRAWCWAVGRTVRGGSMPRIALLAVGLHRKLHQDVTPAMPAYTRALTSVVAAYFLGMVVLSVLIYLLAPWSWWSLFCNLLTPLAAALLFVGEHLLRYRRHPEFARVSLRAAFDAYQHSSPRGGGR